MEFCRANVARTVYAAVAQIHQRKSERDPKQKPAKASRAMFGLTTQFDGTYRR
jgi:hypothetical protein